MAIAYRPEVWRDRFVMVSGAGYLLGAAGGITLIVHPSWSLYPVAASCIILLVRTVRTAWMLMFERPRGVAAAKEG